MKNETKIQTGSITVEQDSNNLLHELVDNVKDQNTRLGRIESALLGDDSLGSEGFIERYKRTEDAVNNNTEKIQLLSDYHDVKKKVDANTNRLNKIYWGVSGAVPVLTVLFNMLLHYLS